MKKVSPQTVTKPSSIAVLEGKEKREVASVSGYPVSKGVRFTTAQKLQTLRQWVLKDPFIDQELAYFVPPNGQIAAVSTHSEPLQPWVEKEFLQNKTRMLLLQGPGGCGKSTFNLHLLRCFWQNSAWTEWKLGTQPPRALVPLFIPLGSAQVEPRRLLHYLTHLPKPVESFTEDELNILKSDYALLLIADGYDEMPPSRQLNLYDVNGLDRYNGRIKLVVSSRELTQLSDQQFVPHTTGGRLDYRYYRMRHISSFNESQTADYLDHYLKKNRGREELGLWSKVSDYQGRFKTFSGLESLITTPFLLRITAEVLPKIVEEVEHECSKVKLEQKERKELKAEEEEQKFQPLRVKASEMADKSRQKIEITRLKLYHQFMMQWFERQANKAVASKELLSEPTAWLSEEDVKKMQAGSEEDTDQESLAKACIKQAYLRFCQQFALHLHEERCVKVSYPPEKKRPGLGMSKEKEQAPSSSIPEQSHLDWVKTLFGSQSDDWRRVRQGCPLRRSAANEYEFLHASLIDFFAATITLEQAAAFTGPIAPEKKNQPVTPEPRKPRRGLGMAKDRLPATALRLPDEHPELIQFLIDDLKTKNNQSYYYDQVLRSRMDTSREASRQASNAATILAQSGANVAHLNWKGVKIPGADLRCSVLYDTCLADADLEGATLARIIAPNMDLQGANLQGIRWGEQPHIKGGGLFAFHPFNPWMAVCNDDDDDDDILLINYQTYEPVGELLQGYLQGYKEEYKSISFSPDGRLLASITKHFILLWDISTRKLFSKLPTRYEDQLSNLSFSPDSRLLAFIGGMRRILLWEVSTQKAFGKPITVDGVVSNVSFSPDGQLLASASAVGVRNSLTKRFNTVRLWEISTQKPFGEPITVKNGLALNVLFSPDGRLLAIQNFEGICLWEMSSQKPFGNPLQITEDQMDEMDFLNSMLFSPSGRLLAKGQSERIYLWEVSTQKLFCEPIRDCGERIVFSPDERFLAISGDGKIILWEISKKKSLDTPIKNCVGEISFSPDGRFLAGLITDDDKMRSMVGLWEVATQKSIGALTLMGHTQNVNSFSFSRDGRFLASASDDKTIRLWDVMTQKPVGEPLTGHTKRVISILFSPDGRFLASQSDDRTIRLWDVSTGKAVGMPIRREGNFVIDNLLFSPDGQLLAEERHNEGVYLWDVSTQKPLGAPLTEHQGEVQKISFSPDGRFLATLMLPYKDFLEDDPIYAPIRLWKVSTQKPFGEPLLGHTGAVLSLSFSSDGQLLASGGADGVRLWEISTQKPFGEPLAWPDMTRMAGIDKGGFNMSSSVSFSPDNRLLASSGVGIRVWEISTQKLFTEERLLKNIHSVIQKISFSPDGRFLAAGDSDQHCTHLLEIQTRKQLNKAFTEHIRGVVTLSFSPDGKLLATMGLDGIRLWEMSTQKSFGDLIMEEEDWTMWRMLFSPDGQWLVSTSSNNNNEHPPRVRLWEVSTQKPFDEPLTGIGLSFSPTGRFLALSLNNNAGTGCLWEIATQKSFGELLKLPALILTVSFSPKAPLLLASGDREGMIRLWDVSAQKPLGEPFIGHNKAITRVSFSPDGRFLASSSHDKTIRLWDVATQKSLGESLIGHTHCVNSVEFSPDGRFLASASDDKTIRLWDVLTQKPLGEPLMGHTAEVTSLSFTPNGELLASGSQDNSVRLWEMPTRKPFGDPLPYGEYEPIEDVRVVSFSPNGQFLAAGGTGSRIYLWEVLTQKLIGEPFEKGHNVTSMSFSPDSKLLASTTFHGSWISLLDISTQKEIGSFSCENEKMTSVSFNKDGSLLASAGGEVPRLWEVSKQELFEKSFKGNRGTLIMQIVFSPNGLLLASICDRGSVCLWDAATQKPIGEFELVRGRKSGQKSTIMFSPDSQLLAAVEDKTIDLWEISTQKYFGEPLPAGRGHVSISFSSDSRLLISGSEDCMIRLWDVSTGLCINKLEWCLPITSIAMVRPNEVFQGLLSTLRLEEDLLAVGCSPSLMSVWAVSRRDKKFRFLWMPPQSNMPLFIKGAVLQGCRMDRLTQLLLEQYRAGVGKVDSMDDEGDSKPALVLAEQKGPEQLTPKKKSSITEFSFKLPKETLEEKEKIDIALREASQLLDVIYPARNSRLAGLRGRYQSMLAACQNRPDAHSELQQMVKTLRHLREDQESSILDQKSVISPPLPLNAIFSRTPTVSHSSSSLSSGSTVNTTITTSSLSKPIRLLAHFEVKARTKDTLLEEASGLLEGLYPAGLRRRYQSMLAACQNHPDAHSELQQMVKTLRHLRESQESCILDQKSGFNSNRFFKLAGSSSNTLSSRMAMSNPSSSSSSSSSTIGSRITISSFSRPSGFLTQSEQKLSGISPGGVQPLMSPTNRSRWLPSSPPTFSNTFSSGDMKSYSGIPAVSSRSSSSSSSSSAMGSNSHGRNYPYG